MVSQVDGIGQCRVAKAAGQGGGGGRRRQGSEAARELRLAGQGIRIEQCRGTEAAGQGDVETAREAAAAGRAGREMEVGCVGWRQAVRMEGGLGWARQGDGGGRAG
jgi:hypothetical protein